MLGYKLAGGDKFDVGDVLAAIRNVLPKRRPIGHHEPLINGRESAYVHECVDRGVVGYDYVDRFEHEIATRVGVDYCVATSSGTSALHVALLACGVAPNDEILVPTLTFAATANAVCYVGAVPNFVDGAFGIHPHKLAAYLARETVPAADKKGRINKTTGRKIWGLILVHLLGRPAETARIMEIAQSYGLEVIEDAAEALGSVSGNRHCGTSGLAGIFSFNNNKIATTNGGGAIVTNDEWIAAKSRQLASTARVPHPWLIEHDALGFNYPMGNLNAALGLAQLEQLDAVLDAKRNLADDYGRCCADTRGIQFLVPVPGGNNWLNAIEVDPRWEGGRDEILRALHADGIFARCLFTPLHSLAHLQSFPRDANLLYAEDAFKRTICLPSGPGTINDRPAGT